MKPAAAHGQTRGRDRRGPLRPHLRLLPGPSGPSRSTSTRPSRCAGGVLYWGIPEYRLPNECAGSRRSTPSKRAGVKIHTGRDASGTRSVAWSELREQPSTPSTSPAATRSRASSGHSGREACRRWRAACSFLRRIGPESGPLRAAPAGGRGRRLAPPWTARAPQVRLGAEEVTVVYRRTAAEMPAGAEEIVEAQGGGHPRWMTLASPRGDSGRATAQVVRHPCCSRMAARKLRQRTAAAVSSARRKRSEFHPAMRRHHYGHQPGVDDKFHQTTVDGAQAGPIWTSISFTVTDPARGRVRRRRRQPLERQRGHRRHRRRQASSRQHRPVPGRQRAN